MAVAADFELPPQQSEMFGHRASSQTVCRFRPLRSFLIFLYDELSGIGVFSHEGRRVISFCLPFGPTKAVFSAYASDGFSGGSLPLTKSVKEGPALSLSAKRVGRTRGLLVGESIVGGSKLAVANDRERGGRKTRNREGDEMPLRQRNPDTDATIMRVDVIIDCRKSTRVNALLHDGIELLACLPNLALAFAHSATDVGPIPTILCHV